MTDWRNLAACLNEDPEAFFPDPSDAPAIQYAKSICGACPVRTDCLEAAIREEGGRGLSFRTGIRGGTTPAQRVRTYWRRVHGRTTTTARPKAAPDRPRKVTREQRIEMRALYEAGTGVDELAAQYGVHKRTVFRLVSRPVRKSPTVIDDETRATIARRRLAGEGPAALAREYNIVAKTVQRIARAVQAAAEQQQAAA